MLVRFFPNAFATVYTEDYDGAYTVIDAESLPCRLFLVGQESAAVRAELVGRARFQHDPAYSLPTPAQVEVDGIRWQVVAGTVNRRPSGPRPVMGVADVVRVGAAG